MKFGRWKLFRISIPYAEGSCLIKCGNTHVVCTGQHGRESAGLAAGAKSRLDYRRIWYAAAGNTGSCAA